MKVYKKSGKPFKSGNTVNTVKSETVNEQDPKKRLAYSFYEDDSIVNKAQCEIYEGNKFYKKNKKILELEEVMELCGANSLIEYYAMSNVETESAMSLSYLKRRISQLWSKRSDEETREQIKNAVGYIRALGGIYEESSEWTYEWRMRNHEEG